MFFLYIVLIIGGLILIGYIAESTENSRLEKELEVKRQNNEVIKEYQYKDFKIKKTKNGEYLVEYQNNPVDWDNYSIGLMLDDKGCKLEKGFKYGKKITIEQVYKNLKVAEKIGYYC